MTSRLDPFFSSLFQQLNQHGLSYQAVCNDLLSRGVSISPQALRSWHLRRSAKIAERSQKSIAPGARPAATMAPADIAPHDLPGRQQQTLESSAGHLKGDSQSAGFAPLQAQIEEEERRLFLQAAGPNFFPVRRKLGTDSSEQRISTTANWQTKKGIQ